MPISSYCPLWVIFGISTLRTFGRYWLDTLDTQHGFVASPESKARLYHYSVCLVVVPYCLQRKLIRLRGSATLSDVGLLRTEHSHTRYEDKAVRVSSQNPISATRQSLGLR